MKKPILFLCLLVYTACHTPVNKVQRLPAGKRLAVAGSGARLARSAAVPLLPIQGYRFHILGDFDGDGSKESLKEHFYSMRDQCETNKYYTLVEDIWQIYDSARVKRCISFMLCSKAKMDTVPVWGELGPLWVKNEGDLDNDGGDELSFVPGFPQMSSINHCYLLSYKQGRWQELYNFEIREWQIPPLPGGGKTYGPFGAQDMYSTSRDSINKLLLEQFNRFPGFIKKLSDGKTRINCFMDWNLKAFLGIQCLLLIYANAVSQRNYNK